MPYTDLDSLLAHIWNYVEAAVIDRANAMTTPAFATASQKGPNVRTIALRKASRRDRTLVFHTDARSDKMVELEEIPKAVWMGWDDEISEQFQFVGQTTIHRDDELAVKMWRGLPEAERAFYFKPSPPGAPASEPGSGIRPGEVDEETARKNFAVIRTVVDEIKWLYVGRNPEDERQARYAWAGEAFHGKWIVP